MDRQAIDVHDRNAFSNANCALPKTGQKRRWRKVRFCEDAMRRTKARRNLTVLSFVQTLQSREIIK